MKKRTIKFEILGLLLLFCLTVGGCAGQRNQSAPDHLTVIRLWHAYNAYAKEVFDASVAEFNETVGAEEGIVVESYGYGSSDELYNELFESAGHIIGSEPLPDIFSAYPDNACELDSMAPLVELDRYFTEEELEEYRPEFLKEGIWGEDAAPKMLPISKSTEMLFVNWTDFKRFSQETGVSEDCLKTWEGLLEASEKYSQWSGGKAFLGINSDSDFSIVSATQLGETPYGLSDGSLWWNYPEEAAKKVWNAYYVPHIKGIYKSKVYNQDGVKSGELLAYIGSSAGAGYFPEEVIVDEQHSYPVQCKVFPFPSMEDGSAYMTQRGANMAVFASEPEREKAAAVFLKWFTVPEENLDFALATGYLPVKEQAFEALEKKIPEMTEEGPVEKSLEAAFTGMEKGEFYSRITFPGSYGLSQLFRESLAEKTEIDLEEMKGRLEGGERREQLLEEYLSERNFKNWYDAFVTRANEEIQ